MVTEVLRTTDDLQRTSIMTIPNEKTSASLLCVPVARKIAGAVHRTD